MFTERLQVLLLYKQRFSVLFEEEAYPGDREFGLKLEGVLDDGIDVEELDHLQRAPDLLPAAAPVRCVEHIHKRALKVSYPYDAATMALFNDAPPSAGSERTATGACTGTNSISRNENGRVRPRVR